MARILDVDRTGTKHQAGSDSLITLNVYKALQKSRFKDQLNSLTECMIYGVRADEEQDSSDNSFENNSFNNDSFTQNFFIKDQFNAPQIDQMSQMMFKKVFNIFTPDLNVEYAQ